MLFAQEGRNPKLLIKNDTIEYLKLDKLSISVYVLDNLATTTMTMRFYNNSNRVLEGELNFPLGEGQNISRFAMDVNGKMREGVVVEKAKGTEIFESIVYRKVDPGLLEMTEGNNFKSRVYPINPKGYKTIIVAFEHDLIVSENQYLYVLPLNFKDEINEFDLDVEVVESEYKPVNIDNTLVTLNFNRVKKGYKCEFSKTNFNANFSLGFNIPMPDEKLKILAYTGKIEPVSYFYKTGKISNKRKIKEEPKGITIYWDNSGSALKRDFIKELTLLHDFFSWASNVEVELITFANDIENSIQFVVKSGNWEPMRKYLENLEPDGGTQLGKLNFNTAKFSDIILFSDGLSNYGLSQIQLSSRPVSVINSSMVANHSYLKFIAQSTSGDYINLNNITNNNAIELLTTEKLQLLWVEHKKDEISDLYINNKAETLDRFSLVGKIQAKSADVTLHFGYPNRKTLYTQKISIDNCKALDNNLVERFWVQQKLNYLNVNYNENKDEITSMGKKYGIVTKTTSLIVLDEITDYVTHNIIPPVELQAEYYELQNKKKESETQSLRKHLDDVFSVYADKIDRFYTDYIKVAEQKREMVRLDSLKQIEKTKLDSIAVRNKFVADSIATRNKIVTDSTQKAEQVLLNKKNKAIADSILVVVKIKNDSLLLVRNSSPLKAISGIVYSTENNLPLPGANIVVKGTSLGTMTDLDGRFSLKVPENAIVTIHFIGFITQEIDVSNLVNFAIKLENDNILLDEIQVIAYGVERLNVMATSSSMVNSENILYDVVTRPSSDSQEDNVQGSIDLKEWNPNVPYLDSLKLVSISEMYNNHLKLKKQYLENPSYFLDVATLLMKHNDTINAIRVLSNLSEIQMQNHEVLRVLGRKLLEFGETTAAIEVFKQVLDLRPFEPHSYRDLGLAFAENKDYQNAIETLYKIITKQWSEHITDKFEGIESIVIGEINSIIVKAGKMLDVSFIDKQFLINLPVDIRVVLNWDADNTDMDLWVTDPMNEKCYYGNRSTNIGGFISDDLSAGYGPEEFLLKNAIEGNYVIEVDYYGDSQQTISGPVTIQVYLYTNFGRSNETVKSITVRISENKEVLHVGNLLFEINK